MSKQGELTTSYTQRGLPRYQIEVRHDQLNKYQLIRGDDPNFVREKARTRMAEWDAMWERRDTAETRRREISHSQAEAMRLTEDAKKALGQMEQILVHTLGVDDTVDWDSLKNTRPFPGPVPQKPSVPPQPQEPKLPPAPDRGDSKYSLKLSLFDRFSSARRALREREAEDRFTADRSDWAKSKATALATHASLQEEHARRIREADEQHAAAIRAWDADREAYIRKQAAGNASVDAKREKYLKADPEAIVDYCDMVLSASQYPDCFPKSFELAYNPANKIVVVDYQLPAINDLPTLAEVRYLKSEDDFAEKHLSEAQVNKLFDSILYQVALRSIHEIFEADAINAISAVVFNGYVHSIDKATGREVDACVLTVQAGKEEFLEVSLENVDPKACFKKLRGVGSSKLHSLTPVAPLLKMNKEDSRFVTPYAVADQIDEGRNLASMDWEDFEHLIRELFEKEFAASGGDVKITRASRDGGIDAVVFDPDPIRGGKIVIQAKRYTNTVSVSAVRDLFGAIMNEGANKGILVTTADFGPDAYEFAKDKPIVLLSGGNLLHMLGKHGIRARIDLKEAKEILEQEPPRG